MRLSVSATGGAFGEHLGLFVCLVWSKMSRSLPRLSPSGDVAGAPGDPVQDPADAVLMECAWILKIEREKIGGYRFCKAAGWLCAVVVSNLKNDLYSCTAEVLAGIQRLKAVEGAQKCAEQMLNT
jgi:hypothetical protein